MVDPRGPPDRGTYVRYDHEAMVGVMALEASGPDAVVVGEIWARWSRALRDYLRERGLFRTSIRNSFELDRDDAHHRHLPAERGGRVLPGLGDTRPAADGRLPGRRASAACRAGAAGPARGRGNWPTTAPSRPAWLADCSGWGWSVPMQPEEIIRGLYAYLGRTPWAAGAAYSCGRRQIAR